MTKFTRIKIKLAAYWILFKYVFYILKEMKKWKKQTQKEFLESLTEKKVIEPEKEKGYNSDHERFFH